MGFRSGVGQQRRLAPAVEKPPEGCRTAAKAIRGPILWKNGMVRASKRVSGLDCTQFPAAEAEKHDEKDRGDH
jgi:hypothetical protein